MARITIYKNDEIITPDFGFNIFSTNSNIQTNIWHELKKFNSFKSIDSIYEDLFVISLAVIACDKRFFRGDSTDAWTRIFDVFIPVLNIELFEKNKKLLNKMLSFLTGDKWNICFYETKYRFFQKKVSRHNGIDFNYDFVSLFSGGLDSFCGAIGFFENKKNGLFIGNKENRLMDKSQKEIFEGISNQYTDNKSKFFSFNVDIHKVLYAGEKIESEEKTTRSRSFMFICSALLFSNVSGRTDLPIYVPENGFIGLNLPLTPSRRGSCSTRTTHPYYFMLFNQLLRELGLKNTIINPFKYFTKKEIVNSVENSKAFKDNYHKTLSCSHPNAQRWFGKSSINENCGKCYPCLIRQSSLCHLVDFESMERNNINNLFSLNAKGMDNLYAVLNAVYQYKNSTKEEIKNKIISTGYLNREEVDEYLRVYIETMKDLIKLFKNEDLKKYIGEKR